MDLQLRPLRCFLAVASERSFTRAAAKLGITQPSLSLRIRELEAALGFSLFDRSTRSVELSEEGAALLAYAERAVEGSDRFRRMVESLRHERDHQLNVGLPLYSIEGTPEDTLVDAFIANHPALDIKIQRVWMAELIQRLRRGALDLAFVVGPLPDDEFDVIPLGRSAFELLIPKESPLAAHDEVPLEALKGIRVLTFDADSNPAIFAETVEPLRRAGAETIFGPEASPEALQRFGRQTRTVTLVSGRLDRESEAAGMVMRPIYNNPLTLACALARRRESLPAAAEKLWAFVQKQARDHNQTFAVSPKR